MRARFLWKCAQLHPAMHIHQGRSETVRAQNKQTERLLWPVLTQAPRPVPTCIMHPAAQQRQWDVCLRACARVTKEIMGVLKQEQQCRIHTHPSTHTHRRVNQFRRHLIQTHSSECMNFSRPPGHPPPNLYMMDYHHSQPHQDGDCERESER